MEVNGMKCLMLNYLRLNLERWFEMVWDELLNWLNNEIKLGGGLRTKMKE